MLPTTVRSEILLEHFFGATDVYNILRRKYRRAQRLKFATVAVKSLGTSW